MSIVAQAQSVENFRQKLRDLNLQHFPVWEMEKLTDFIAYAVAKLSPFQVGDTAVLAKAPEIEESSGWWVHRKTLVEGRKGVIREVDWSSDGFFFYLWEPENQTWVASVDGKEHPVDRPYNFGFSERCLRHV